MDPPSKPIHSTIVTEKVDSKFSKRIILVYKLSNVNGSLPDYLNNNITVEKGGISNLIDDEIIAAAKSCETIASQKKMELGQSRKKFEIVQPLRTKCCLDAWFHSVSTSPPQFASISTV